jgi:hypothetical protein
MNESNVNKSRKRGKRMNSLDVPQRFLDHLTLTALETATVTSQTSRERTAARLDIR